MTALAETCRRRMDLPGAWSQRRCDALDSLSAGCACRSGVGSWLEVLVKTPQLDSRPVAAAMFKELIESDGAGAVRIVPQCGARRGRHAGHQLAGV